MARLDQICSLNMGQSPDSSSYNENGEGMPFFQGNADFGKVHPRVRVWCSAPTKVAHTGDVLISVRAPIGALNIADRECCIGRGLAALTVNEELCNKDYLWYAIASKVEELNSKGTGSTFKAISKSVLAETEIPLPTLGEQQGVARQLAKVDELIALRKEQLAKLDQLVKSRFIELFGVCDTYELLKDSNIYISDGNYSSKYPTADEFVEEGIPFIRAS
ncbi:MAG: restriction endonuclease subunit S, partial [Clostridia bacterium]|nr:restriction endonuclease subunit S [Clostridia bacterium]